MENLFFSWDCTSPFGSFNKSKERPLNGLDKNVDIHRGSCYARKTPTGGPVLEVSYVFPHLGCSFSSANVLVCIS